MCKIENLGERIRKLRKQKQLTLEALAGDQLTKGMLSLIENGKANPSMESLNYIAHRLGVETTDLLAEVSTSELWELLEQVEELFKVEFEDLRDERDKIIQMVQPYVSKMPYTYESARLLEIYSRCLFHKKMPAWRKYYEEAIERYERLNLVNHRAKMIIFFAMTRFTEHQYAEALSIIQNERKRMEQQNVVLDAMTRLDYDYYESILCFAVGETEKAVEVMNKAIKYSKEHRIFYLTDELYRLAAFEAMMAGRFENMEYYQTKLSQYAAFADYKMTEAFVDLIKAHYNNTYAKDYETALTHIEKYFKDPDKDFSFFYPEMGKALYGLGQYSDALKWFEDYKIPEFIHHPYDLSMLYEVDSYKALCYLQLGHRVEALKSAKLAADNVATMPHTPYKDFINQTFKFIQEKVH